MDRESIQQGETCMVECKIENIIAARLSLMDLLLDLKLESPIIL